MKILLACPAPAGSRHGNRVTALRWAKILRNLGHRVCILDRYDGENADLLVALHARRSAPTVGRFRRRHPDKPVVLALTGTDVYRDIHRSVSARRSIAAAARLIVLQPLAIRELPRAARGKARVIYQSVERQSRTGKPATRTFDVCVIAHLRPVKDPLRAAMAARRLPVSSRIRIVHAGKAMSPAMGRRARSEMARNPRYRWLGERSRGEAHRILGRARLMILSSWMEGGANVVSEALAGGIPILASRIPGSIGLLGEDYPGYFPAGDTAALAALLRWAETDDTFLRRLRRACARRASLTDPRREMAAWRRLLEEVTHDFRR